MRTIDRATASRVQASQSGGTKGIAPVMENRDGQSVEDCGQRLKAIPDGPRSTARQFGEGEARSFLSAVVRLVSRRVSPKMRYSNDASRHRLGALIITVRSGEVRVCPGAKA